jgi:hypothetical protein
MDRRHLLGLAGTAAALASVGAAGRSLAAPLRNELPATAAELSRRTFQFFWDTTNAENGLAPDRWPSETACSIAALGFALTAWPIGVENGWIDRAAARTRTLTTLRFLANLPQGDGATGVAGHKGFFYHFLDMKTGLRTWNCELSTVDTTWLMAGVLFARNWFDRADDAEEREIRALATALYWRVDWAWAVYRKPAVCMGWTPEKGWLDYDWRGYSEGMLVYLLGLGSPTHPLPDKAWAAWTATYPDHWGHDGGRPYLAFPPMFGHQYSHVWVDFRGIQDAFMRSKGIDYFENSRRAVMAQKAYADANPGKWAAYGGDVWGLTACDGPGEIKLKVRGRQRTFKWYSARGAGEPEHWDDGTIAPTAAAASAPFAPKESFAAIEAFKTGFGGALWTRYGFPDAFNPSFEGPAPFLKGKYMPGAGWVDADYLGIDQGPILTMLENQRSGLVWEVMRRDPDLRRGLKRAGFAGGWLGPA